MHLPIPCGGVGGPTPEPADASTSAGSILYDIHFLFAQTESPGGERPGDYCARRRYEATLGYASKRGRGYSTPLAPDFGGFPFYLGEMSFPAGAKEPANPRPDEFPLIIRPGNHVEHPRASAPEP